jgi:hypothetical protein
MTELVLGLYGGSRPKFLKAQHLFFKEERKVLEDLRYGIYLGSEAFSKECIQKSKIEEHREKPQLRELLRSRDIQSLAFDILKDLGGKKPDSVLNPRKGRRPARDMAIYILYRLGIYRNEEIGRVLAGLGKVPKLGLVVPSGR